MKYLTVTFFLVSAVAYDCTTGQDILGVVDEDLSGIATEGC